ncbi:unnamed protein product [Closterium sp. NIES-54]
MERREPESHPVSPESRSASPVHTVRAGLLLPIKRHSGSRCQLNARSRRCADVVVAAHPNGWMDADSVLAWLNGTVNPYVNPRFGVRSKKVMLVLDSYCGHLTDAVKAKFGNPNIVPTVIPAGCTSEIQPLDVAVNRSFKAAVRQLYQEWFESEGVDCLTERG